MEEQAFYKTINSIVDDLHENAFGVRILYDMCSDRRYAWGNKSQLADKLCFISRLYQHQLRECFLKFAIHEVDGKECSRHRQINVFSSIADMLWESESYKAFVEKVSTMHWQFDYDAGDDDLNRLKESLFAVLEFNDILKAAIERYDELYNQQTSRRDNIPFASKFLHFHRSEQFFIYDHDIRKGRTNFRAESGCRIGSAIIDNAAKAEISSFKNQVLKFMYENEVLTDEPSVTPKIEYLVAMALQYAICCYIRANYDKVDRMKLHELHSFPLVSAEILTRIRKIKTQDELNKIIDEIKPETPIEELALYFEDVPELDQFFEEYGKRNSKQ